MNKVSKEELLYIYSLIKTPYKYKEVLKSDDFLMDSPVVFKYNNLYYMTFVRIDKNCNTGYKTLLAKSFDLIHFEIIGEILKGHNGWDKAQTGGYAQYIDNKFGGSNEILKVNDNYYFAYVGGEKTGYETDPLSMGLGYTNDIDNLDSYIKFIKPILSPNDSDSRYGETRTIYKADMFIDEKMTLGHKYVCAYNAKNDTNRESIFLAVSDDGINYKRYLEKPIIDVFDPDKGYIINGDPQIVTIDEYYVMFYFIYDGKTAWNTFAASKDLINWTLWDKEPLIKPEFDYENVFAHKQWVIKENDIVYHYYCAVNDKHERFVALATSKKIK